MGTPYTYLIGWSDLNQWYYGSRYSKLSHPDELMVSYFTSSVHVKEKISKHGMPDVIQIRRTFSTPEETRYWEHKVLKRMKVIHKNHFLNKTDNIGFEPKPGIKRPGVGGVRKGTPCPIKNKVCCHNPITLVTKYVDTENDIPYGYVLGGAPKSKEHNLKNSLANKGRSKHSVEQKRKWSRQRSGKNVYDNNFNSKRVVIDGVEYTSIRQASEFLNISRHKIKFYMKNGYFKPKQKTCEYCGATMSNSNYTRWHGQNCRLSE